MKLTFDDIVGKHRDVPGLVIAHGPSLNEYLPRLGEIYGKGFVFFGMNHWYTIYDISPDYWTLASVPFPGTDSIPYHYKRANALSNTLVYADSTDLVDREWCEQNVTTNYLPYDQRHFQQKRCSQLIKEIPHYGGFTPSEECCKQILPRLTIQEQLQHLSGFDRHYKTGDTVCLHALAIAVLCGCNPIYLTGIDLDYRLGYAGNITVKDNWPIIPNLMDNLQGKIAEDFLIINESAKLLGIKIYNLNHKSLPNIFEYATL